MGTWHDLDVGRPIAAPLERCALLLGVDLAIPGADEHTRYLNTGRLAGLSLSSIDTAQLGRVWSDPVNASCASVRLMAGRSHRRTHLRIGRTMSPYSSLWRQYGGTA